MRIAMLIPFLTEETTPGRLVRSLARHWPIPGHWLVLVAAMGLFGCLSCRFGKDTCGDLFNYHFYNPYMLCHGRIDYDIAPAGLHTFLNPIFDLPFYAFVSLFRARTVGFFMGAIHGVNAWLVYLVVRRALAGEYAWKPAAAAALALACTAAGMYGPIVLAEVGTLFNDLIGSLFVLSALHFLLGAYQARGGFRSLALAGALAACSLGKLTDAIYLPAFLGVSLMIGAGWRHKLRNSAVFGLGLAAGLLLTSGYWTYLLSTRVHNPIFPYYNKLFRSEYFPQENFSISWLGPKSWTDVLTFPYRASFDYKLTAEYPYRDWRYFIALVVLGLAVVRADTVLRRGAPAGSKDARSVGAPLVFFFFVSYVVWLRQFGIARYAVGLEMLAPLVILLLFLRMMPRRAPALVLALTCWLVIAGTMKPASWGRDPHWGKHYFEDELPQLAAGERAFVIFACQFSVHHLIPLFPEQTRFANPAVLEPFYPAVRQALQKHDGSVYLITDSQATDYCKRSLDRLGLETVPGTTQVLRVGIWSRPVTVEWVRLTPKSLVASGQQ